MNWIITKIFGESNPTPRSIFKGSRVRYQGQMGTVIGGSVHIKFDKKPSWHPKGQHENNRSSTFNISKDNIEVVS